MPTILSARALYESSESRNSSQILFPSSHSVIKVPETTEECAYVHFFPLNYWTVEDEEGEEGKKEDKQLLQSTYLMVPGANKIIPNIRTHSYVAGSIWSSV